MKIKGKIFRIIGYVVGPREIGICNNRCNQKCFSKPFRGGPSDNFKQNALKISYFKICHVRKLVIIFGKFLTLFQQKRWISPNKLRGKFESAFFYNIELYLNSQNAPNKKIYIFFSITKLINVSQKTESNKK